MINAAYGLFSAWYCPFAQRTWMALEEARLPYDYIEIDPYNKTREWLSISRGTGQVPVLEIRTQDTLVRIPDSVRTIEFLNDVGTDFKPMGKTEMERSEQRYQIDNLSKILIPYFYRFLKAEQDSQQAQHAKTQMLAGLRSFVAAMSSNGPFFPGAIPSLVWTLHSRPSLCALSCYWATTKGFPCQSRERLGSDMQHGGPL